MNFQTIKETLSGTTQAELEAIAKGSKIPLPTLIKIKYRQTKNPRIETVEQLSSYLSRHKAKTK